MYISVTQSHRLDTIVKDFEVAFRSFISDVLVSKFATAATLSLALSKVSITGEIIYSRKFQAKIKGLSKDSSKVHLTALACQQSITSRKFDYDVPYVSELIDIMLIFFNEIYSHENIAKGFSSIEEFHYCSTLYHTVRNNLSHPASRPITELDAAKVAYFVNNISDAIDERYFWYRTKAEIAGEIDSLQRMEKVVPLRAENLSNAVHSHKQLVCRDEEIAKLYAAIIGCGAQMRLAGSVALYGYGGVGKTAITTEFLLRVMRDKKDGKCEDIEFILFYSSKDEVLRTKASTGELYIDAATRQFETKDELLKLICNNLSIYSIADISSYVRGIIVIDNIENIVHEEKLKILALIKSLPRTVQFIVTSRSEESCEEKVHVEEFTEENFGNQFILDLNEAEGFNLVLTSPMTRQILSVSKGNALIILQILNNLSKNLLGFSEMMSSLDSLKSKNSEIIASFMYKNTFDRALLDLAAKGYPATKVIQIISLYNEPIELYSISKLANIAVASAESLCNLLLERLILTKTSEYYELNEFAKRFVFIKLLPDKVALQQIRESIHTHKRRMTEKLTSLEQSLARTPHLRGIVSDWQPRNYIDKIVIAELLTLYLTADSKAKQKNEREFLKCLIELKDHSFITNHPFVAYQTARMLKLQLQNFRPADGGILLEIEAAYEEAIESIEFNCRYLMHSSAHTSLLMHYGVFLAADRNQHDRAIRYLEECKKDADANIDITWFTCCNYLSKCYRKIYETTKLAPYKSNLKRLVKEVFSKGALASKYSFDIVRYKREYSRYS